MGTGKMREHRERTAGLVFMLGLSCSSAVFLHPVREDALAMLRQTESIGSYEDYVGQEETGILEERYRASESYNRVVFQRQKEKGFSYRGADVSDEEYNKLPCGGDRVMGYLEIPAIRVLLPIAHGTGEDVLQTMAGHIYGTSIPVGGTDTHAVLAAHTGLASAELFNDLVKLVKGDVFAVRILGRVLYYRVDEIRTTLPEEADTYLGIREGRDLVTLYTCTPYGINDHRLLVTGTRTDSPGEEDFLPETGIVDMRNREAVLRLICAAAVPPLIASAGAAGFLQKGGKSKE